METNFTATNVSQYADSKALVFWLKTPAYNNPAGDLANLSLGLITNGSRWTLNQSPVAGMEITYISESDSSTVKVPLKSQGGGVFLDAPSDFTGWVIIPLDIMNNNAWGTAATSKDFSVAPVLNLINEWTPSDDNNKQLYFDSIGLVKNISAFKLSLGAKPELNISIGSDYEANTGCAYYAPSLVSDNSYFNSSFSQKGRSAELSLTEGYQFSSNFAAKDYLGSQSLVFWLKTPEYDNPYGDLSNIDLGLICGASRWAFPTTPTAGMEITYIADSNKSIQKIPLKSQGGGVYLDAPSNFTGWVVIPLDIISRNAWGTGAVTKDLSVAPQLGLVFGWTPTNDVNKKIYFDSVGLTKDTSKFLTSVGAKAAVNMTTGIDFEKDSTAYAGSTFNSIYKEYGRSVEFNIANGTYFEAYFNASKVSEYSGSQALVFWLKTPVYDNPTGDLANLDLRLAPPGASWKLNQTPTAGMEITYISDVDHTVQNIPLTNQGGVHFDAPSDFTGWAIIPLNLFVDAWGNGGSSINLASAPSLVLMSNWAPTNDIGKKIYIDSVGLTQDINSFKNSIIPAINYSLNSFNVSSNNLITKVVPGTKVSDFTTAIAPTQGVVSLAYTDLLGNTVGVLGNVGTGTTVDVTINGSTKFYDIIIYGDVDGDGNIAVGDLAAIKGNLLKINTLFDEPFSAADLTKNGTISISDLLMIKKHILNISPISQN